VSLCQCAPGAWRRLLRALRARVLRLTVFLNSPACCFRRTPYLFGRPPPPLVLVCRRCWRCCWRCAAGVQRAGPRAAASTLHVLCRGERQGGVAFWRFSCCGTSWGKTCVAAAAGNLSRRKDCCGQAKATRHTKRIGSSERARDREERATGNESGAATACAVRAPRGDVNQRILYVATYYCLLFAWDIRLWTS
jgi:hypothetical protein